MSSAAHCGLAALVLAGRIGPFQRLFSGFSGQYAERHRYTRCQADLLQSARTLGTDEIEMSRFRHGLPRREQITASKRPLRASWSQGQRQFPTPPAPQ